MTRAKTIISRTKRVIASFGVAPLVLVVVGIAFVIALAASRQDIVIAGCGRIAAGQIVESQKFTPFAKQFTLFREVPMNPIGAGPSVPDAARSAPRILEAKPIQLAFTSPDGNFALYYFDRRIDDQMLPSGFLAGGGIVFTREPGSNGQNIASVFENGQGDRGVSIEVAAHEGALVWADPGPNEIRTHNLYWGDGTYDYSLIAVRPPEVVVNLARGIACAGG
ncbi:MAG: hypothetical protein ACRDF7_05925 [Candidatus Limnocylindrales bacterium]